MSIENVFLNNIWYYAVVGEQLKRGKVLAKTILNEPILFGRSHDGEVFALRDICPHRAIPLSCGRFDGLEVECSYHGWRFDMDGQCTKIPSLSDDQTLNLDLFRVKSYLVREVQGNIWIYMPVNSSINNPTNSENEIRASELDIPEIIGFDKFATPQAIEITNLPFQ